MVLFTGSAMQRPLSLECPKLSPAAKGGINFNAFQWHLKNIKIWNKLKELRSIKNPTKVSKMHKNMKENNATVTFKNVKIWYVLKIKIH